VKVDGVPLNRFAGLGSWAAFTKTPHGAMVMGDTVVFQDEVTPAMDAAFCRRTRGDGPAITSSTTNRRLLHAHRRQRAARDTAL